MEHGRAVADPTLPGEHSHGRELSLAADSGPEHSSREKMIEAERVLAMNRAGWDRVAPRFHGSTALPEYGPLAPSEDTLRLLDATPDLRALELGCGSGHSLRYLAERGARELWGVDLSPVQIAFAEETLRAFAPRCRLFESPMEVNPGIPAGHFDLVFSIWGMGWTTDLPATLALVAEYLRPEIGRAHV